MKKFFNDLIIPALVILAIVAFFVFGRKVKFFGEFAYEEKKKRIDKKTEETKKKIEENNKKLEEETSNINSNEEKINKLKEEKEKFEKELENAKNNHDRLDDMFGDLFG